MSVTQESPWRRHGGRLTLAFGHHAYAILLIAFGASLIFNGLHRPGWLQWPVSSLFYFWLAAWFAQLLYHDSHLCERCIAATPLNPQAAADRWRRFLWLYHQHVLGLVLAAAALVLVTRSWHLALLLYLLDSAGLVILLVIWTAEYKHRRLYPWCPFCHWGDGGGEEPSPVAPAPDEEKV